MLFILYCVALLSCLTAFDLNSQDDIVTKVQQMLLEVEYAKLENPSETKSKTENVIDKYIINGDNVAHGEFPFTVALFFSEGYPFSPHCGGSLIDARFVLTSASCVLFKAPLFVEVGRTDVTNEEQKTELIFVKDIYTNPVKKGEYRWHDIAIIELKSASQAKPVSLPSIEVGVKKELSTLGFGSIVPNIKWFIPSPFLKKTTVEIVSSSTCGKSWGKFLEKFIFLSKSDTKEEKAKFIKVFLNHLETALCTVGKENNGVCYGDAGGPLILTKNGKHVIYGIASFWHPDCKNNNAPDIATSVFKHVPWIKLIINKSTAKTVFSGFSFFSSGDTFTEKLTFTFNSSLIKVTVFGLSVSLFYASVLTERFLNEKRKSQLKIMDEDKLTKTELIPPAEVELEEIKEKLEMKQAGEEKKKSI